MPAERRSWWPPSGNQQAIAVGRHTSNPAEYVGEVALVAKSGGESDF